MPSLPLPPISSLRCPSYPSPFFPSSLPLPAFPAFPAFPPSLPFPSAAFPSLLSFPLFRVASPSFAPPSLAFPLPPSVSSTSLSSLLLRFVSLSPCLSYPHSLSCSLIRLPSPFVCSLPSIPFPFSLLSLSRPSLSFLFFRAASAFHSHLNPMLTSTQTRLNRRLRPRRPQSMSAAPSSRSPTTNAAGTGAGVRQSMPPPARGAAALPVTQAQASSFVNAAAPPPLSPTPEHPAAEVATTPAAADDPDAEDVQLGRAPTTSSSSGARERERVDSLPSSIAEKRMSRTGTMNPEFKFPMPVSSPVVASRICPACRRSRSPSLILLLGRRGRVRVKGSTAW
ncbi:hypothetical protein B0H14DRAFT_366703 [Mycena olivaceomarginata]|nr:hypothetical protein B0H14DRAFT_366703 [Mycena olivaceomarginata]